MKLIRSAFILAAFSTSIANAQTDTLTLLDPVTISATAFPIKTSQAGRNVTVIQGSDLAGLPVQSLDDLLKYVPGIELQARGPMGSQSDIVIRGGTFQQVLVIVDGVRINDPLTGHFSSYIPIAPAEIERIEVLKGAASALYGTEAVGGVINIITKPYAAKKSSAQIQTSFGEYGYKNAQAGGAWVGKKTTLSGGYLLNKATGQPQRGTRGFFDNQNASLSLHHQIGNGWNLGLRSAWQQRDFSAQNFYTSFVSDTAQENIKGWLHHARLHYHREKLEWRTDVSFKNMYDRYLFSSMLNPNQNRSEQWQINSLGQFTLNEKTRMITGLQFLSKKIKSNDRGNHTVDNFGLFAIWKYAIRPFFSMEPTLRMEHNSLSGTQWLPQLTVSYKPIKTQWRASFGRSLRDADFTERFNNYNRTNVRSGSIGNPNLKTETSWSSELGADFWLGPYWRLSTGVFHRYQTNLIDFVTTPYANMPRKDNLVVGGTYALAKNIAQVNTFGIEADFAYARNFGYNNRLLWQTGLLWLNSQNGSGEPGFYISSHARFLANSLVTWHIGKFQLSTTAIYKNRKPRQATAIDANISQSYFLLNAKASLALVAGFNIFIQTDNVLNTTYSDLLGAQMPKRWLLGGLTWRL